MCAWLSAYKVAVADIDTNTVHYGLMSDEHRLQLRCSFPVFLSPAGAE